MKKTIETVNFEAARELVDYVNDLFDTLPKYHNQILSADIFLKQHSGESLAEKEAEIKVYLPGHEVFSSAKGENFQEAANLVLSKVKRQLLSLKEKDRDKHQPRPDKPQ